MSQVRLWDMERGECVLVLRQAESFCRCLSFIGNRIVSGDFDGIVHFWEITQDKDNKYVLDTPMSSSCQKNFEI